MNSVNKRILCIILSACLVIPCGTVAFATETTTAVQDTTQADVVSVDDANETLESQRIELEESLAKNQEKLSKFEESAQETQEYIDLLDEEIGLINKNLEILNKEISVARKKVNGLNKDIKALKFKLDEAQQKYDESNELSLKLKEEYDRTYAAYCLRLRAMYISGADSIIVALLTSKDIGQFLDRYEMIKAITKSDTQLLKQVQAKIVEIKDINKELEKELKQLESSKTELDAKQTQLVGEQNIIQSKQSEVASKKISLAEKRARSDSLLAKYTQKTQMYSEFKYEDEQMIGLVNKEIDDLISGLKDPTEVTTASANSVTKKDQSDTDTDSQLYYRSDGVYNMRYPAPGHYRVSQGYGHYSNGNPHPAIDFPYPVGSKVVAAQKGIVVKVKRLNYSYGYYIMIYHGTDKNGKKVLTLYAHNSSILVNVGQTVKKGQQIAKGGSTGNSTGPHCHFEIIAGGKRINPTTYLSKK